ALGPDLYPATVFDAFLLRQLLGHLHEELRLHDRVHVDALGPIVEVFHKAIGSRDDWELLGIAEHLHIALEHPRRRIAPNLGEQGIGHGRLEGLVVHREWTFSQRSAREQARHTFGEHYEGAGRLLGWDGRHIVWHIWPGPALAVPEHVLLALTPR